MTSRKIALRENIATLPTLLNCFYYFMYRTKSGPHMLTYFKSTKPILSRQTWKIQKCIFEVWRGILLVVNFFSPIEKTASLAKQEKTRRGRRAFSSPMIPQSSLSSMRRENGTRRANKKAETDLEIQ